MDPTISQLGSIVQANVVPPPHAEASADAHITKSSTVGKPWAFTQGQFKDQTIRVVISEIQKVARSPYVTEVSNHGRYTG